jgi:hypothetical protein
MRLFRLLCCVLALAEMAAVPTSSAQTGNQQNAPAPATGQAPANPIQDATQSTSLTQQNQQQQQQEQAEAAKGKPSSFDIGAAGAGQQDQELGEVRLMTRHSELNSGSPQGLARSFHNRGENDLAEFNFFLDKKFFSTGHRFQFLTMYRGTDDSSIDPERNSIQKGFVRIYGPHDEYIFGDALVNYSRLTVNQNIKGASASWRLAKKWKLSATGGVFIDRWGSLFKDQLIDLPAYSIDPRTGLRTPYLLDANGNPVLDAAGNPIRLVSGCQGNVFNPTPNNFVPSNDPQCGRPFTAAVSAARLEYAFARDSTVGFNWSSSNDLVDTRAPLAPNTPQPFPSPLPASNKVGSIDFKYQLRRLRMDGEFAYSATNFDTRATPCGGDSTLAPTNPAINPTPCDSRVPTAGGGVQGDWGARLDATYRWHKFNFRSSYVRYQPNFASMNARQISDLQDFLFRVSYDALPWLTMDGTMRRNNNNLKQQLPYETTILGPEARLIFHDFSFYRRAALEVGYRHRIIDGSAATLPLDATTLKPTLTANCVSHSDGKGQVCIDRILRQPYVELTLPIHTTFLTLGYERRQSIDLMSAGATNNTNNTNRFYASLRGVYDFGGWHVSPNFRYELERQGHRLDLDTFVLPTTATTYVNPFQLLFLDYDSNRLGTASLLVEAPKWFILEAQFRDTTATITVPAFIDVCLPGQVQKVGTPPACPAGLTPGQKVVNGASGYSRPSYRVALTYKLLNDENKVLIFSFERNSNFYFGAPSGTDYVGVPPGGAPNPLNFDERIAGVTFVYKFGKRGR